MVMMLEEEDRMGEAVSLTLSCLVDAAFTEGIHDLELAVKGKDPNQTYRIQFDAREVGPLKALVERLDRFYKEPADGE